MSTCDPATCHGWAAVWCMICGVIAPCARVDCPSCGQHPEIHAEANERRARKLAWRADGTVMSAVALKPKSVEL